MDKDFRGKYAMQQTGHPVLLRHAADRRAGRCRSLGARGAGGAANGAAERQVGRLTSGGYSVAFGKSIGIGYVAPDLATEGTELQVRMFRDLYPATVTGDSPYDPTNAAIRVDG